MAAAANLTEAAQPLASQFESQTGIHPVFSFASTAQLTSQIENGAPFDVFLAADAQHVDELDRKGLVAGGTSAVYALGVLALWIPSRQIPVHHLEDLVSPAVHVIAIAQPELAPYGAAAVEALRHVGIWDRVSAKIVYAENVNQVRQYGASGNADAVFTAYSLVLKDSGVLIPVDQALHQPIAQKLAIPASSKHPAEAKAFIDFILRGKGREVLSSYGYRLP